MSRILFVVVALFIASCCADGACSADPSRYGVVKIAFGDSIDGSGAWRPDQLEALRLIDRELDALGPDFVIVSSSDPESIVIRPAALPSGVCGRYRLGETTVEVDPSCTGGYEALRKAASHEIVHALLWRRFRWAKHLCWFPLNQPVPNECHPTIVCQDCLMSPNIQPGDEWGDSVEEYTPGVAISPPQQRDIDLVRGCFDMGRCE